MNACCIYREALSPALDRSEMPSSLEFLQVQTLLEASFSCVISPFEVCHLPKKPLTFCNPLLRAVLGRA